MTPPQSPTFFTPPSSAPVYRIFTDGGARGNPGPAAAAYVIYAADGRLLQRGGQYVGDTTNNVAEYQGVLLALTYVVDHLQTGGAPLPLALFLDSLLVCEQLRGTYKIKQSHLRELAQTIHRQIEQNALQVSFHHVPRDQNAAADAEVNRILDEVASSL